MSDSYSDPHQNGRNYEGGRDVGRGGYRSGSRGGRPQGNREGGGFRIRLSDNEMNAARSIQEAFNLRSTVAVLGFALRTIGQMLEDGQLNELIEQHRAQGSRGVARKDDGTRRTPFEGDRQGSNKGPKPNPFARPAKPEPTSIEPEKDSIEENQEQPSQDENNMSNSSTDLPEENLESSQPNDNDEIDKSTPTNEN